MSSGGSYRTLNELREAYELDTLGLGFVATAMSNDAQVFAGLAYDPQAWAERPFYAKVRKGVYD